ncbi:universal stress protein [Streptomyces sp. VRA16 Mangrove soil]|uniref:universal stress protein n=1 Tax=Streptomyces sp. VRA16 Mangrove soil TaxID=2817434 RepID=UPI001A9E7651|nr:universal stress protein [Streptomyces sp. VRA16 Mangrove soil]MBO1334528.1 universal stress protein [Streptomyces sp. VRA16 Mangrove soil]
MPHPLIVVGVDQSQESAAAVVWAAREAVRRAAPLKLLHVGNWTPRTTADEADAPARRRRGELFVRSVVERLAIEVPVVRLTVASVPGPATAALLDAGARAGLLVLGSRGLGALSGAFVGSVAAGVIARAPCPVVLVRADTTGTGSADGHDVVLGLDLGDPCDDVIEFAFAEAGVRGTPLRILSAWHEPNVLTLGPGEVALADAAQQAHEWEGFQDALLCPWKEKHPDVPVVRSVVEGPVTAPLLDSATGAALLVIGNRRRPEPRLGPRTGPVTHAVIHHAPCAVAVVPHD